MNSRRLPATLPLIASIAALLTGCASIPGATPSQAPRDPHSFAAERSLTTPTAQWPTDDWWRAYGDPQLSTLIEEALGGSPTLAAAQARVAKANRLPFVPTGHPITDALSLAVSFYVFVERFSRHRGFDPDHPPHLKKITETL